MTLGTLVQVPVLIIVGLYVLGAYGLARLGGGDAWLAGAIVAVPQVVVAALLLKWERQLPAAIVGAVLVSQLLCMARLLREPDGAARRYRIAITALYVVGALATGFAIVAG